MADSMFAYFNEHPIFPSVIIAIDLLAFFPLACLIYIAQIAPLHGNCRYILCVWCTSFGVVYVINIAAAILDINSASGYMPLTIFEPRLRFNLYQCHLVCTTLCSTSEITISIERIVAIIRPRRYHFSGFACKTLVALTVVLILMACTVDFCVHSGVPKFQLIGCAALAVIELSGLVIGATAVRVCRSRSVQLYTGKSSLTERYQVNEAYEMSRAMIAAYLTSFFIKAFAVGIVAVFIPFLASHDKYAAHCTGFVEGFYIIITVINGSFSMTFLLLKHPQLRKRTLRKFRKCFGILAADRKIRDSSAAADTVVYFSMLSSVYWK